MKAFKKTWETLKPSINSKALNAFRRIHIFLNFVIVIKKCSNLKHFGSIEPKMVECLEMVESSRTIQKN